VLGETVQQIRVRFQLCQQGQNAASRLGLAVAQGAQVRLGIMMDVKGYQYIDLDIKQSRCFFPSMRRLASAMRSP
jgi:hypothetical protein